MEVGWSKQCPLTTLPGGSQFTLSLRSVVSIGIRELPVRKPRQSVPTSVRLSHEESDELERYATQLGLSQSDALRDAVRRAVSGQGTTRMSQSAVRRHDGQLIQNLGLAHTDLRRIGNLFRLALKTNRPVDPAIEDQLVAATRQVASAAQAILRHYRTDEPDELPG